MERKLNELEFILLEIRESQRSIQDIILSQKAVLNFSQAVDYLGMRPSYLYKLTSTHQIPYYKPNGKLIYFSREELDQWLMQNRVATKQEKEQAQAL
jgi:excisionase family DNA binding protein